MDAHPVPEKQATGAHLEGHRRRLRERFAKTGLEGFADYEVVELLLTLAIPRSDVKKAAKALIDKFGSVRRVLDAPASELQTVEGIGSVAPIALQIIRETANLYLQQRAEEQPCLADTTVLCDFWRAKIGALADEIFQVAYLDSGYRLLRNGIETLEEGTKDRATVYPRRVMEAAIRRGAAAIVFAHNHPNGDTRPSEQDRLLTRALVLAAETLHIKVVDHLVVTVDKVLSFRKEGLL